MVMVVMAPVSTSGCAAAASADRLRQILQVGQLAGLRGAGEIGCELRQLGRRAGGLRLDRLRFALQVGGDLRGELFVFAWVRLLKLLQPADQLCKGRKPAAVGLGRRRARGTRSSSGRGGCIPGNALESADEGLLQIRAGQIRYGTRAHEILIGMTA
jgi:hypothetical protein